MPRYPRRHSPLVFVLYRFALGGFLLLLLAAGVRERRSDSSIAEKVCVASDRRPMLMVILGASAATAIPINHAPARHLLTDTRSVGLARELARAKRGVATLALARRGIGSRGVIVLQPRHPGTLAIRELPGTQLTVDEAA